MARADEMAEQLKGSILGKLGPEAEQTVFRGEKPPKNPVKRANWVKETISNLDEVTDAKTRSEIMNGIGVNCANHNAGIVKAAVARRAKYKTLEAFIDAEIKRDSPYMILERDEDTLILSYLPRGFSHPMRCFCGLVNALPEGETMSITYCQCSVAFVETWWSKVVEKPVKVKLLESAITGSNKCRFMITW